ncbi:hypothetical protein SODG_001590 [Sodalis praecaptivus]
MEVVMAMGQCPVMRLSGVPVPAVTFFFSRPRRLRPRAIRRGLIRTARTRACRLTSSRCNGPLRSGPQSVY